MSDVWDKYEVPVKVGKVKVGKIEIKPINARKAMEEKLLEAINEHDYNDGSLEEIDKRSTQASVFLVKLTGLLIDRGYITEQEAIKISDNLWGV